MAPAVAFALASTMHAGFQLTVTVVVYPALATRTAGEWRAAHDRHSRAIAPLVVLVYGALLATGGWVLVSGPSRLGGVALVATGLTLATTALGAAPIHGRLTGPDPALVRRLLVVDRFRCLAALTAAVLAVASVS